MNNKFNRRRKLKMFLAIPFMITLMFGLSTVVMLLWNAILPDIIGVKQVDYWQAFGLLILSKILFGGLGSGNRFQSRRKKMSMRKKMANMSEEERMRFREEWRKRC